MHDNKNVPMSIHFVYLNLINHLCGLPEQFIIRNQLSARDRILIRSDYHMFVDRSKVNEENKYRGKS